MDGLMTCLQCGEPLGLSHECPSVKAQLKAAREEGIREALEAVETAEGSTWLWSVFAIEALLEKDETK